jgi:predicted RNase H-like HicB family nuclease
MSPDRIVSPVTIQAHEEGGYLAVCEEIRGCHADGDTLEEALENVREVAEMIWELCVEENLPMPPLLAEYRPGIPIQAQAIDGD